MSLTDMVAIIVSIVALGFSLTAIIQQQRFFSYNKIETKPDCRIRISSKGDLLNIRLENVGARLMVVDSVKYSSNSISNNEESISLSNFFKDCPCKTRTEERVNGQHLQPGQVEYLYTSSFKTQDDLLATWEVIKTITVKVDYKDSHGNEDHYKQSLEQEYQIFKDALGDRVLMAFQNQDNDTLQQYSFQDLKLAVAIAKASTDSETERCKERQGQLTEQDVDRLMMSTQDVLRNNTKNKT